MLAGRQSTPDSSVVKARGEGGCHLVILVGGQNDPGSFRAGGEGCCCLVFLTGGSPGGSRGGQGIIVSHRSTSVATVLRIIVSI